MPCHVSLSVSLTFMQLRVKVAGFNRPPVNGSQSHIDRRGKSTQGNAKRELVIYGSCRVALCMFTY